MRSIFRTLIAVSALVLLVCMLLTGCENTEAAKMTGMAKPSYRVMIDDVLYVYVGQWATYRTDENPEYGGHFDGEITSTVDSKEFPEENDQSNFGIGYPYRYGKDNTVEVFFSSSDRWKIFEPCETQQTEN